MSGETHLTVVGRLTADPELRDAGVLTDDHAEVVTTVTIRAGEPRKPAGIHFTIEETQ